jgi:hypothetical protein
MTDLLAAARTAAVDANFAFYGVDATLRRPDDDPSDDALTARLLWATDGDLAGREAMRRTEAQRVAVIRRSELSAVPRGTRVTAPERMGGSDLEWVVDGLERMTAECLYLAMVPDDSAD